MTFAKFRDWVTFAFRCSYHLGYLLRYSMVIAKHYRCLLRVIFLMAFTVTVFDLYTAIYVRCDALPTSSIEGRRCDEVYCPHGGCVKIRCLVSLRTFWIALCLQHCGCAVAVKSSHGCALNHYRYGSHNGA